MGCYDVKQMVQEFSKRTWRNIETVDKAGDNAYEVTQIVNSLVGLVLYPYGKYKEVEPKMLKKNDPYNKIQEIIDILYNDQRLYSTKKKISPKLFIRSIRNSVAHSGEQDNLMFYPKSDSKKEISHVIFHSGQSNEEFCVMLRCKKGDKPEELDELRELTEAISNLYSSVEREISAKEFEDYDARIDSYIELMKTPYRRTVESIREDDVCMLCKGIPFRDDDGTPYLRRYQVEGETALVCPNCEHKLNKCGRSDDFKIIKTAVKKRKETIISCTEN